MGVNFSGARHVYLHQFENPNVKVTSKRIMIRLVYDEGAKELRVVNGSNPFAQGFLSTVDESQRAVISYIQVEHICNEMDRDFEIQIDQLFDLPEVRNQDASHPDDTGKIVIFCARKQNDGVAMADSILYRPRLADDLISKYAGTENAILKTSTQTIDQADEESDYALYHKNSPMVCFIMDHGDELAASRHQMAYTSEELNMIRIHKDFVDRVRQLFQHTVWNDLRYTRFEDCKVTCDLGNGQVNHLVAGASVCVQLNVCYYVVSNKFPFKDKTVLL